MRHSTIARPARSVRRINAIDLENKLGGTEASSEEIAHFFACWARQVGIGDGDRVVVACSHRMARKAWFALPDRGIQRVVRSGPSGADLALLDAIELDHDSRWFSSINLGSGDGIFTEFARAAIERDMTVRQIVGVGASSRRLTAACTTSERLDLVGHGRVVGSGIRLAA